MRDSLRKSLADTPAQGFERYPKGSVVVCNACAACIFTLDRAISLGAGAGQAASAFKPVSLSDLASLARRRDIDAGVCAQVRAMTPEARQAHVAKLHEMRAGDPMLCPICEQCFVQVLAVESHEVLDKSYTIELLTIPPKGAGKPSPVRGKRIGAGPGKDWVH